jgi:ribonuclease BN (tRNA processing enzyme)
MRLTVLGCSGSYPGPGAACSGYLLEAGDTSVWMDAGPGTLANLQLHTDPRRLDAVVLSHAHPDHWTDVLGFHVACKWYLGVEGVAVHSTAEVRRLFEEVAGDIGSTFDWGVVDDGARLEVGDLTFRFSRTDHGPETLAMRVDGGGRSLVYSADTGPGWSLASLGPGIDVFLGEATLDIGEEGRGQHLSARQAASMAAGAGAGRLILTHLRPGRDPQEARDEAAAAFDGAVEVATTNERFEL